MVNEDIFGGLEAARARKQPLGRAMISLLNAGYEKDEIREAAILLRSQKESSLSKEVSEKDRKKKKTSSKSVSRLKWKSEKFKLFPEKRKFRDGKQERFFKISGINRNNVSFEIRTEKRPTFPEIPDDWDKLPEKEIQQILSEKENFTERKSPRLTENFVARERRERERMTKIQKQIILEYKKNRAGDVVS